MIRNFNQFINENLNDKRPLSIHDEINEPFADFIDNAQMRLNNFTERIGKLLHDMDIAIEAIQEELWDVIVGEPNIKVNALLSYITVEFQINVPNNDEGLEADSTIDELEDRLNDLLDTRNEVEIKIHEPNEDGNCVIILQLYVLEEDNFGDYTDALSKLGE
jgi:hypothetical protein